MLEFWVQPPTHKWPEAFVIIHSQGSLPFLFVNQHHSGLSWVFFFCFFSLLFCFSCNTPSFCFLFLFSPLPFPFLLFSSLYSSLWLVLLLLWFFSFRLEFWNFTVFYVWALMFVFSYVVFFLGEQGTLICPSYPNVIIHTSVHSWCHTFCGFRRTGGIIPKYLSQASGGHGEKSCRSPSMRVSLPLLLNASWGIAFAAESFLCRKSCLLKVVDCQWLNNERI